MRGKKTEKSRKAEFEKDLLVEIEFICPVRGKVKQLVKGTKYKTLNNKEPRYTVEEILGDGSEVRIDEED